MPAPNKKAAQTELLTWYAMKAATDGPDEAELSIYDEIGTWGITAQQFIADLKAMARPKTLRMHINSPGGSVFEGNAIYNALVDYAQKGTRIEATIDGLAASMASIIAMAADKITMPENAFFFIHNPYTVAIGDADALRSEAELLDKLKQTAIKAYQRHAKTLTEEQIGAIMDGDTWMSADEALGQGFAEEVTAAHDIQEMSLVGLKRVPENVYAMLLGIPQMPYPNEHACRLREPSEFDRFRRTTREHNGKTYSIIMGKEKGKDTWGEQAYRYAKDTWTVDEARAHCTSHDGKTFEPASGGNNGTLPTGINTPQLSINHTPSKGGAMKFDAQGNLIDDKGIIVMTAAQIKAGTPADAALVEAHKREIDEARIAAATAENKRVTDITKMCTDGGFPEMATDLAKPGVTIEQAQKALLDKMVAAMNPTGTRIVVDETDKMRGGLSSLLNVISGAETRKEQVETVNSGDFRSMRSIHSIVKFLGRKAGVKGTEDMSSEAIKDLFMRLYSTPSMGLGMNTNDLHSVLDTSASFVVAKAFAEAPTTYQFLSRQVAVADLKTMKFYKNSNAPDLLEIPEGQPPKFGVVSDKYEEDYPVKFGGGYSITEEAIINDRTDVFSSLPQKWGWSVGRWINTRFWETLLAASAVAPAGSRGPTLLETNRALLNATEGNLLAAGTAISAASLSIAFQAMENYALLSPDGGRSKTQRMGLTPKFLVVGPSLKLTAWNMTSSQYVPSTAGNVNQLTPNMFGPNAPGALNMISEPQVETVVTATHPWLCVLDPNVIDHALVLVLRGRETPRTASRVAVAGEAKGIFFDIEHFAETTFIDWRGWYYNAGV